MIPEIEVGITEEAIQCLLTPQQRSDVKKESRRRLEGLGAGADS